MDVLAQRDG